MRYLTARKRAEGKGASGTGTEHHWYMSVSAVGLAIMVPTFLFIFGRTLGGSHEEVLASFAQPFPAILSALVLVISALAILFGLLSWPLRFVYRQLQFNADRIERWLRVTMMCTNVSHTAWRASVSRDRRLSNKRSHASRASSLSTLHSL